MVGEMVEKENEFEKVLLKVDQRELDKAIHKAIMKQVDKQLPKKEEIAEREEREAEREILYDNLYEQIAEKCTEYLKGAFFTIAVEGDKVNLDMIQENGNGHN